MRTGRMRMSAAVAAVVTASLLQASTSSAATGDSGAGRPEAVGTSRAVRGRPIETRPRTVDPAIGKAAPEPHWPEPGQPRLAVGADGAATARVLDRAAASRAGVAGIVFTVDNAAATRVRVDYSGFAQAYGGSYGSRLRLVRLPGCALTTPERPECRAGTPVLTRNDGEAATVSADVDAGATVFAAVAGAAGDKGDYRATSLSASATWSSGGNSGAFSWSYPMRVPPVPGGLGPDLAISYSSASVDGRTANTNNQPSWVGEGFDLWPGYIERSYQACAADGAPTSNGVDPGDQCWAYDNATVTWNGRGGELIRAADGTWRSKHDDGTRFERLAATSTGNGDNDGEYWKATTVDGTQYFFGRHRLPGWTDGKAQTNSTWTVPVFGNNDGEPCHDAAGFAPSWCQQAWRWNLDYVVDTHGNAVAYYYTAETNSYGRNVTLSADTPYERGGYLNRIEYGLRSTNLFAKPSARVVFGTAERCIVESTFDCAATKIGTNPDKWPDVPWDQNCAAECTRNGKISPTFWSRKRLTGVTTQVQKADGTFRDVDSWTLAHAWGDADIDRALLLTSIQHTGRAGGSAITLPKVTFNHVQLMNRLDRTGDDIPPFIKYRIGAIFDESGGQLDVSYSGTDCSLTDLPTPETNTRRCFPIYWQPAGKDAPIRDWFHKYVATQVIVSDRTALAPDMVTTYAYLGGAAWHFDDDDGLTRTKEKTWSQWRGYGQVRVTTGGDNAPQTRNEYLYLRGMDGDRLNTSGGAKSVTVADGEGGSHVDHESLTAFELKHTVYTGPNGGVHDKTVNTPWRHQTASRTRSWGTTSATLTGVGATHTWTAMDAGAWRQTHSATTHDVVAGLATQVDDQGDTATAADDRCTRTTFAVNSDSWLRSLPSRSETVSVACAGTPDRATDVITDARRYYDGGTWGAPPTKGDATRVEKIATHNGTTATYVPSARTSYDAYGRVLAVTDAGGNTTSTAYADTAGLSTKVTVTGPPVAAGAHVTVTDLDPAWGLPLTETNPGGQTTTLAYDALGRQSKVWLPGREGATVPDTEFGYRIADGKIVAVTTRTLTASGGQRTSHKLLDGLLRTRQTQAEGPNGGRLITDTIYDSRGNVARRNNLYYATGAPATELFGVAVPGDVESQHTFAYDGLNRVTTERFLVGNNDSQERWRTVTSYGGNWVAVDPPDGGTPSTTFTDARGRKTELRQYKGAGPAGAYEATRYTYHPNDLLATVTDPGGAVWSHEYDLRGREVRTVDPDRGTSTSTYDDLDRVVSTTDARGQKVFRGYDSLGRLTATRDGSATGTLRTTLVYDTVRKGQLTSATRYSGGQAYTSKVDAYDNLSRPVRSTIVIPATEGALAGSYTFTGAYNLDGTVQSNGYPAAGGLPAENVVQTYDDVVRPTRLTSNLGSYVTATVYSATGKPLQYEQSTGGKKAWQTYTWELGTNRLATSRTDREGIAGVDRNATYAYDPAGNITSISDVSRSGTDTQCFAYDHVRRLTEAWAQGVAGCAAAPSTSAVGGPAAYWQSHTYDTAGNRTVETLHGGQADTIRAYANQGHRLNGVTQTGGAGARRDAFGYDAAGNLTTRTIGASTQNLAWDAEGALTAVTEGASTTSFVYGPDGGRLIRRDSAGATLYLPGMELRLPTAALADTGIRYYTHNAETLAMRTTAGVRFLAADHQDTAQLTIDASSQALSQRRFTPFGAERGSPAGTWPDEKTFVGGTEDATGLTHLGAREYDPAVGRFVSVDPLRLDDPQQLHGYSYANYSPVTSSDPSGLAPCGGGGGGRVDLSYQTYSSPCEATDSEPGEHDSDSDFEPGTGGGGGSAGGSAGGSGSGGGAGGGHRRAGPPPIGPVRICAGWCAVKDKIGDHQGGMRRTHPDPAVTLECTATPNNQGPYPVARTSGECRGLGSGIPDWIKQFGKGLWKTCKEYGPGCISLPEELLAPLVLAGLVLAAFTAACVEATALCIGLGIVGAIVGIVVGIIILGKAIYGHIFEKGKPEDGNRPGNRDR